MKQKAGCAPHCDFLFVNMTKLVVGFQGRSNASTGARDHTHRRLSLNALRPGA